MEPKKFKLPKPFAEKWVAALRSGKYTQGVSMLCDVMTTGSIKYCCMGIAGKVCDVPDADMIEERCGIGYFDSTLVNTVQKYIASEKCLPKEFDRSLGGGGEDGNLASTLGELNDVAKLTFNEIADWVEANVEFYEEVPNAG